jgi:RNA polymerase-binding transcription factor DksA
MWRPSTKAETAGRAGPAARVDVLRDPLANRGTAFGESEHERLALSGWLPRRVETLEEQAARALEAVRAKATAIERYAYLSALQSQELRDIDAARARLKNHSYGICMSCGDDIGFERLRAYPTAKRCLPCQQQRERTYAHGGTPTL